MVRLMSPPFDTSQVSPSDAIVTLRSLRRRFREVLTRPGVLEAPGDQIHLRPGDGRLSPAEHAAWTVTALSAVHRVLRTVQVEANPSIELPPVDVRPPVDSGDQGAETLAAAVGDAAEALADDMAGTPGSDWTRIAQTPQGPVTALDIARLAVRIGAEHLRAAEQALASVAPEDD